jgi:predicted nucleic acid-binding protein
MLIDSDVLVWLTRGHVGAAERLRQIIPWRISAVTYIELAQGCRSKAELGRLKSGLAQHGTQIIAIKESISERAMQLIDQHAMSNGLQLGDALIAATALEQRLQLLTGNRKHFAPIAGLTLERFAHELT